MAAFKENLKNKIKKINYLNILFALLGGVLLGFTIRNIHEISPITEGGMLGLTLLIDHWLHISSSITTPILNILCYLFAFKIMGPSFIFYSVFAIAGYAGSLAIFELFPPLFPEIANIPWLASIVGGIGVGISCGTCVLANSGPTADDALAMAITKVTPLKITVVYLISDLIVLSLSLTYIPWQLILYSLLTVIISGQIIGIMQKIQQLIRKKLNAKKENKIKIDNQEVVIPEVISNTKEDK